MKVPQALWEKLQYTKAVLLKLRAQMRSSEGLVLGRTACLGQDLFALKGREGKHEWLLNQQKARADLFMDWVSGKPRPRASQIAPYLTRKDVYPLLLQQQMLPWLAAERCDYILIDSFSELTDQKFTHREEGWSFSCHYSDVVHNAEFEEIFNSEGLIPLEEIENVYSNFIEFLTEKYPSIEIYFVHFSTKLDDRQKYKSRGEFILKSLKDISQSKRNVKNVFLEDNLVDWHENDKFPYHYSKKTNEEFLERWLQTQTDKST